MSFFSRRRFSKSDRDRDRSHDRNSHPSISNPQMPQSPPTSYAFANGGTAGSSHHGSRPASSTAMSDASYDFAATGAHQQSISNAGVAPAVNPTNTSHRYAHGSAGSQPTSATAGTAGHAGSTVGTSPATSRPLSHANPFPSSNTNVASGHGSLSRTDQIILGYFWQSKAAENAARDLHYLRFPAFGSNPGMRELVPFCEIYSLVKSSPGAKVVGLGTMGGSLGGGMGGAAETFIG